MNRAIIKQSKTNSEKKFRREREREGGGGGERGREDRERERESWGRWRRWNLNSN